MATSESDDFESADEEMGHGAPAKRGAQSRQWSSPMTIDSDSDDDTGYVPSTPRQKSTFVEKSDRFEPSTAAGEKTAADDAVDNANTIVSEEEVPKKNTQVEKMSENNNQKVPDDTEKDAFTDLSRNSSTESASQINPPTVVANSSKSSTKGRTRPQQARSLGAKKLGARVNKSNVSEPLVKEIEKENDQIVDSVEKQVVLDVISNEVCEKTIDEKEKKGDTLVDDENMPEELKSNKKFKEIFKPQGWEAVGNDVVLSDDLTEDKIQPVLDRLSAIHTEPENSGGWGSWGSWGVSSLINTATAGVSTLSNHVTQGLTLLEETITAPDIQPIKEESDESKSEDSPQATVKEEQHQSSFGFGHIMSGVSSITKLVESTGGKVVIDTLEAIGQKAMEVLQEGDPGLKKKRAFLLNEGDKPNLSQILREAKEKASVAERSIEEKQLARKVHFESLFDDYQGLIHLEALEMLSKQSSIKIQQHLVRLESDELTSMQETLEEVKELCDLGDDDDEEEPFENEKDLKSKLTDACHDLGVSISYDKVHTISDATNTYLALPITHTDQEVFQCAISTIAQFTAYAVERFHKTAELLLIKERRSTVNEADSLVQLTRILSNEISTLANSFCKALNELEKTAEKTGDIRTNITTVFMEATNASSYVQDAFRLLIPILQVGAI